MTQLARLYSSISGTLLCFCAAVSGVRVRDSAVLVLDGVWRLSSSNGSLSLPARVPGCVHTALQQHGFIQDPYFRFNDVSLAWIALENWTYWTSFSLPDNVRSKQEVQLVLEGVDTVASVWLNGANVGHTDNMFRRYEFSVKDLLKDQDNVLQVGFWSPVLYAAQQRANYSYRVPPECPPEVQKGVCHVNFIRKAQNSFSWDWGPSFPTTGLWKGVRLEAFDLLQLVQVSSLSQFNSSLSRWTVQVDLLMEALQDVNVHISVSVPELDSEQDFLTRVLPGRSQHSFVLNINRSSDVKLWFPHTHGEQPFYLLMLTGTHDKLRLLDSTSKVYFRTVELVQEPIPGSPGLSFYFRINGEAVFLKGSNWIPAHSFQDQVSPDRLKNLLQSVVDANMNTLRVWGGGVYEQELFYHLCDQLGILIWQDFMFACALYPTDPGFLQTVREEVLQQVNRLKSHPSIFIWSGNNENEAALASDWFGIPESFRATYITDYVTLYVDNIRKIVQMEDPTRPFLVSSPTNGVESEQEGFVAANPYDPHYGDTHFYSYLSDCWDWTGFPRTRFASEYGFQSWPSLSTLQAVSIEDDWSYGSHFVSHRQHHQDGNQQMLKQASLHFHLPNSTQSPLERFTHTLYITQVSQAQCVKAQTEFYRRSRTEIIEGKGQTMGALYWQLNDIWPAPSWSSIEFGGKWKMLHYFAQRFFADVLPVGFEDEDVMMIYAVSDRRLDLKLRPVVTIFSWSHLDPVCTVRSDPVLVPGGSAVAIFKRPLAPLLEGCGRCSRTTCVMTFHLEDDGGRQLGPTNHHFLSPLKDSEGLQKPTITASVQQLNSSLTVDLRSDAVAAFVWLDVGNVPGRFSDNGFLMTSATRTLTFFARRPTSVQELTLALTVTTLTDVY